MFYLGWEMAGDMDLDEEDPVGEGEGLGRGLGLGLASAARAPSSRDSGRPSSLPSCKNENCEKCKRIIDDFNLCTQAIFPSLYKGLNYLPDNVTSMDLQTNVFLPTIYIFMLLVMLTIMTLQYDNNDQFDNDPLSGSGFLIIVT